MQKIKYRVWIKGAKKMAPVVAFYPVAETVELDDGAGGTGVYGFTEVLLMQYSGLKDKNGVEICAGDIVWWSKDNHTPVWTVVFQDGAFRVGKKIITFHNGTFWIEDDAEAFYLSDVLHGIEIIGSIFDDIEFSVAMKDPETGKIVRRMLVARNEDDARKKAMGSWRGCEVVSVDRM